MVYLLSEAKTLDADSISKNKNLKQIIELRMNYQIPLMILLTHSDDHCDTIKKIETNNWEKICEDNFINNKKNLINYIKKEFKLEMSEEDIIHVVLVEPKQIPDEEVIKKFPKKLKDRYDKEKNEEKKKDILEIFKSGMESPENEVRDFIEEKINVLDQKKLIEKMKEKLPSQYHPVLIQID